ncbi:pseudaminic acid cytidylyltransferase [Ekhidna sp.]|uniref:pseudaminic acid cytidylyltransferase n=1 Tax=Ekhidna sp. TaxID=2608089 RepID=UPI003511C0BB
MGNLCIIPARGGSKRIPRKNIRDFCGKPIISYSIEAARESGLFDEVMVSTDDEEIANVAKAFNAVVPFFRSNKNSDDFASTSSVILEVLSEYRKLSKVFEYACCIYPTAPFVQSDALIKGFDKLIGEKFTSVFPVVQFSYPIWRALKISNSHAEMIWPSKLNSRSQDLEKTYHDAGQWYWIDVHKFQDETALFSSSSGCVVLPETDVQDIDTEIDWKLAEMKFQLSKS